MIPAFSILPTVSIPIPDKVEFAGRVISLARYDMRERYDREQIVIAYNHSNTILQTKRANNLFPILEPILKRNGIPDDFKYLAVIESNLDTRAISGAQAAGLWQLMPKTAQELGLEVNSEVDERFHIEKATEAACKYFNIAYKKYNNWITVAASYNAGMGRISDEQSKQQVTDAFDISLSAETSRYIYRLVAMKRFLENPKAFGYSFRKEDFYPEISSKQVEVSDSVTDWTVWAATYGLSYLQLKDFNVWLRDKKLSNPTKKTYKITIAEKLDFDYEPSNIKIHNYLWLEI